MEVSLRRIEEKDLEKIMRWRMDPEITRYMNTDPVLTPEGQKKWLSRIDGDPSVRYWLISVDGLDAGVMNLADLDFQKRESNWGYYIGEKRARSLKLSLCLEWNLYDYVFETLRLERLYNEVLSANEGVVKLHVMCGSHIDGIYKEHVEKNGVKYDVTAISITDREWREKKAAGVRYGRIEFPGYGAGG